MTAAEFAVHRATRWVLCLGTLLVAGAFVATVQAQTQESKPPEGRVIMVGEGSISVPPDYAQIRSGVTTTAKTVKEAKTRGLNVLLRDPRIRKCCGGSSEGRNTVTVSISNSEPQDPERLLLPTRSVDCPAG